MTDRLDPGPATPEPPAAPRPEDLLGRMIADRYRLDAVVGRGGMATIFRATDTRLGRPVALKLLRPEISADRDLADRFRREALAATVLRHGNIVPCLDTGSDPAGPFLVMELIDGEDLAARLRRTGALSIAESARLGLDISRALAVAHIRGIVHRDVKPSNVLLARDGRALITDFGIARLAADAEGAPGTTLGSVQYFSPEQAQGGATTPASDIYGLGLVLYEALTGRRPWRGDTPAQLALARVGKPAPSPRDVRADVPVDLDAVVRRALAPDPESRFPSGAAMAGFLEPIVSAIDPTVRARSASRGTAGAPLRPSRVVQPARRSSRGRRVVAVVVATAALLLAGRWALAALPAGDDSGRAPGASQASASRAPADRATPRPTQASPPTAKPTAKPTVKPTAKPTAKPTPKPASPICEPFLGLACSLDAGRYRSSSFEPPLEFTVGKGWSTANSARDELELARDTGSLTYASAVTDLGTRGRGRGDAPTTARGLVDAFAATDGVSAKKPLAVHIGGHDGWSVDLTTTDRRVDLFRTSDGSTYRLDPSRTTRLVALDVGGSTPLVMGIQPTEGHTLRQILDTADDVAASTRLR